MRLRLMTLACFLLAIWIAVAATHGTWHKREAAHPSRDWKLAFVRNGDIWLANGNGTGHHLLVKDAQSPAWSPDRKQIAFARGGNVWVARADGTRQRQLTFWPAATKPRPEDHPLEGRKIDIAWDRVRGLLTFSRQEPFWIARSRKWQGKSVWGASIYQVSPKAGARAQPEALWDYTDYGTAYHFSCHAHPAWAPDGRRLAFARNGDIWLGTREPEQFAEPEPARRWGWDVTRIAAVARYDAPTYRASRENDGATHLSWSPDGRLVAYCWERLRGSGTEEIHLLDMASGKHWRLAKDGIDPCFSPDGQWVVYEGIGYENEGVRAISRDGEMKVLLLKDGQQPAW